MRGMRVNLWDPWERVPYLSALELCSGQGAIQIYIYLTLPYMFQKSLNFIDVFSCYKQTVKTEDGVV